MLSMKFAATGGALCLGDPLLRAWYQVKTVCLIGAPVLMSGDYIAECVAVIQHIIPTQRSTAPFTGKAAQTEVSDQPSAYSNSPIAAVRSAGISRNTSGSR